MTIKKVLHQQQDSLTKCCQTSKIAKILWYKIAGLLLELKKFCCSCEPGFNWGLGSANNELWLSFAKRGKTCKNYNFSQYADSVNSDNYELWVDLGNTFFFMRKRFLRNKWLSASYCINITPGYASVISFMEKMCVQSHNPDI